MLTVLLAFPASLRHHGEMKDTTKQQLRATMQAARRTITATQHKRMSRAITERFIGDIPLEPKDIIAGYWPIAQEVDATLLLEIMHEQGYRCCLPQIVAADQPLHFREWQPGATLVPHPKHKILEPASSSPTLTPTVLLLPLLAFDASGYRLGYGGGFYDRTLATLAKRSRLLTVGLAFAQQQVGFVPREAHDIPLDAIITETRTIVIGER